MSKRLLLILLHTGAFWPVWIWYVERLTDRSDEPWGIISLLTALFFVIRRKLPIHSNQTISVFGLIFLLVYIVTLPYLPPLARATLAITSLSFNLNTLFFARSFHLGIFGLCFLSLPIIASLQFYLGFPLRLLTTKLVAFSLSLIGYPTIPHGTSLAWAGELIAIDAPCSGVKLLWCALYVSFSVATFKSLSFRATWSLYMLTSLLVFFTNYLRTLILFFFEAGIFPRSLPGYHAGVGLILGTILILILVKIANSLPNQRLRLCAK